MEGLTVHAVGTGDLEELLPLLRGYCDFYGVDPADGDLLAVSRALIADPERDGRQFIARIDGTGVGFATVYWTWSTLSAARVGTLYDLFVADGTRGRGVGRRLLNAVLTACREHGAVEMVWQTALDNTVAQRLYDGIGAEQSRWLDYSLPATAVLPE